MAGTRPAMTVLGVEQELRGSAAPREPFLPLSRAIVVPSREGLIESAKRESAKIEAASATEDQFA